MPEIAASGRDAIPDAPKRTKNASKEESQRIQTLRGLACVLLVAFHVIGSQPTSGLHVDSTSLYRNFADLFAHVRMPLFTFLSGFVYAYRPVLQGHLSNFATKKLLRLMVPFVVVSTIYFAVAYFAPDTTGKMPLQDGWRIYVFPYVHFWFLQAVLLIFAAVMVLERFGLMATPGRYALTLAAFIAIHLGVSMEHDELAPFSILQAIYLAPFFLLGLGANRFRDLFQRPVVVWTCVVAFFIAMTFNATTVWLHEHIAARGTLLGLVIGATSALTLLWAFPRLRPLEVLGAYSFTIYLFHPFFVGASRAVLKMLAVPSTTLVFVVGLCAGVLGPAVMERVLGGVPLASRFLFGQSAARKRKPEKLDAEHASVGERP
jgi:peptidoglycan/LPS O-acetylase OafA/YrhL